MTSVARLFSHIFSDCLSANGLVGVFCLVAVIWAVYLAIYTAWLYASCRQPMRHRRTSS